MGLGIVLSDVPQITITTLISSNGSKLFGSAAFNLATSFYAVIIKLAELLERRDGSLPIEFYHLENVVAEK